MKSFKLVGALALAAMLASTFAARAADLRFWSWRNEDRAVYEDLIKDFNKAHPDINVKYEAFQPENYPTILSTALAGDKGPDLMMVRAYGAFEAVAKPGYLQAIDQTSVPELKGFPASALAAETMRDDGKIYAVPFAAQTMLVIYNKDLFAKAGIAIPQTWDELVDACKKLKAAGITPFANGTATAWQNETIVGALLSSQLGKDFESDIVAGRANFTDPRFVAALDRLNALAKDYFTPSFIGIDYPSSQALFAAGQAAMFAGGSFEVSAFMAQNPSLHLDVFAAPGLKATDPKLVAVYYDGGYAVNAKSPNKDASLTFLRFLASKPFGDKYANGLIALSPIPGVEFHDPMLAKVADLDKNSMSYLFLVHFRYQEPSGSVLEQSAVQKMLAGKASPAQAGAEITTGIATYYAPFRK